MANVRDAKSKAIKITLNDGVERELKFTLNALAELEDRYGSVEAAFAALDKNSIKALRCVLWAGLLHGNPDLTEQQVGSLIDLTYMQTLMSTLGTAFEASMPAPDNALVGATLEGAQDPNA